MDFLNRAQNKLYKAYKKCAVEYHAGGFFIRKEAIYLFIGAEKSVIFLEKNEGLHPFDNDYTKLLSDELIKKGKKVEFDSLKNNIITYKNDLGNVKIMPSIFSENFNNEKISELLLDWGENNVQIFSLIFELLS